MLKYVKHYQPGNLKRLGVAAVGVGGGEQWRCLFHVSCFLRQAAGHLKSVGGLDLAHGPDFACFRPKVNF